MKKYKQLTLEQRYHIAALKKTGISFSHIAKEINCYMHFAADKACNILNKITVLGMPRSVKIKVAA